MAFFPDKPADNDEIRLGAKQIRENFDGVINDGIVIPKPPLYGEGVPTASLGQTGECYIDTKTGNQYLKNISGNWELKLSLDAAVIAKLPLYGEGEPTASLGQTGQCYIDTKTGNQYLKNISDNWELKLSLDVPVEKVQALGVCSGTMAIDAAYGNIITLHVTGSLTVTFRASASNNYCRVLTLIITNGGKYTITWPSAIGWANSVAAPVLDANGVDIITLITINNGAKWYGIHSGVML